MRARLLMVARQMAGFFHNTQARRALPLSLRSMVTPGAGIFQPYNDTAEDRYPELFAALANDAAELRVLSFGCSTGEELVALRSYFPGATIVGIDASRSNVRDARRLTAADPGIVVKRSLTAVREPSESFDVIFAMAVFRHGALSVSHPPKCTPFIEFSRFENAIVDLVRCLRPGGHLVVEHSNFRVMETRVANRLECMLTRPAVPHDAATPQYTNTNELSVDTDKDRAVVFRKRSAD